MNLNELQQKLIAAARAAPPDSRVPYAFEKRIMARLAGATAPNGSDLLGRALVRAAICCVLFMLSLATGSVFLPAGNPTTFSQDVEQTLFAAVDGNPDQ